MNSGKSNKVQRGQGAEAKRVALRLKDFNYETSEVWKQLKTMFSSSVSHAELKSIASVLCHIKDLTLDRDATRDNRVLIKWFDENWDSIKDVLPKIRLRDENEQVINLDRENIETRL